jgi:mono/diheme cytochrome c family protein
LNASSPAPVAWTSDQLFTYLRNGFVLPHGVAGPMQAVANNLGLVAEQDVKAIATYIGAMLGPATANRQKNTESVGTPAQPQAPPRTASTSASTDGAVLYAGACALCHEKTGQHFSAHGIPLRASKVIAMPDARNLAHVILEGIEPPNASPAALMPGFAAAFSDGQLTQLMAYLC